MTVTSTGSLARRRAALSPPKPLPTTTTCGRTGMRSVVPDGGQQAGTNAPVEQAFADTLVGVSDMLVVRGAREHNLRNISLDLPRDRLIVFTGLSGSGKSSLAFDTIYAEGQRRYVESLSSYARQFLGQMDKPDVDFIEGLSPAISIDQKSASRNPRSTVGTITEVYDYLRLLYARIGHPHCPTGGRPDPPADRRPGARAARGDTLPGHGPGGAGAQGRVLLAARRPGQTGLRPGPGRWRATRAG